MTSDGQRRWESATRVAETTTRLAFAVQSVDPITGRQPTGDVSVSLAGTPMEAVENPSGFHLFLEVETDPVTLVVDGGDRYFDERRSVYHDSSAPSDAGADAVTVSDPSEPVVVTLTPTPAYRFAAGATRIRGTVTDGSASDDDAGVAGAQVSLAEFDMKARTTETGEYVLYVPATGDDVTRVDGTRLVTGESDDGNGTDSNGPSEANGSQGGETSNNGRGGRGRGNNGPQNREAPDNSSPGNDPNGQADEAPANPELTVRHPDYATYSERVQVEAGTLTKHDVEL